MEFANSDLKMGDQLDRNMGCQKPVSMVLARSSPAFNDLDLFLSQAIQLIDQSINGLIGPLDLALDVMLSVITMM